MIGTLDPSITLKPTVIDMAKRVCIGHLIMKINIERRTVFAFVRNLTNER